MDPIVLVFEDQWLSPPPTHVELCLSRAVYRWGELDHAQLAPEIGRGRPRPFQGARRPARARDGERNQPGR